MCDESNGKPNREYMNRELYEKVRKRERPVQPRKRQDDEGHEQMDHNAVDWSEQEGLFGKQCEPLSNNAVSGRSGKGDHKMKESAENRGLDSSLKSGGTESGTSNTLQCSRGIDSSGPEHNQRAPKIEYSTDRTSDQNDPKQIWLLRAQHEQASISNQLL